MSSFYDSINPLIKNIDPIGNFKDISPATQTETEEYPYFQDVITGKIAEIKDILRKLEQLQIDLEKQIEIIDSETGDDKSDAVGVYNKIVGEINSKVSRVNRELAIVDSPYFGKVIVNRDRIDRYPKTEITTYIGKYALFDDESKRMLITDWRAPIANIYYVNSGPTKNIEFETPIGKATGELLQKRQFDISAGRIRSIYDAKSGNASADEFLLATLNRRLGKKLADIVSTIQATQNNIIRNEINQPVILQGVAGSGKTTIVLHRLAYLFYTYPKTIRPEKSLIVAPNTMFLDYISDVLPSLGVSGVVASTYIFWAKKVLGLKPSVVISNEIDLDIKKYKGSEEFLNRLENFLDEYERKILDELPFSESFAVEKRYWEMKKNHPNIYMAERFKLALNATYYSTEVSSQMRGGSKEIADVTRERLAKYLEEKLDVFKIYREFIYNKDYNSKAVADFTKKTLTNSSIASEDLSPLLYIYFLLNGKAEHQKDYVVVDEAQDMSPFELYILSTIAKNGNIFLAGDIAQSIIPPFQVESWDVIKDIYEKRTNQVFKYYQINKCYRTTVEVIEYANDILVKYFPKNYELPEAVLRHGDKVANLKKNNVDLVELINGQFEKGSATVALVCKDEKESLEMYNKLKEVEDRINRDVVTYTDSDYKTGILVLPVNKAKGLEFDSVIVNDINRYDFDIQLDSRLFYVAVTRALHRLFIIS